MPTVAKYGSQRVAAPAVSGARARELPRSAFASAALADAAAPAAKLWEEQKRREDTTRAEDAMTRFERAKNTLLFDPDAGYYNRQGRDAYDGAQGATDALAKLQEQYAADLDGEALRMFSRAATNHVTKGARGIQSHAAKGFAAWEQATIRAAVENTVENAALLWNNPDELAVQRELGRAAVHDAAEAAGIDGPALNENLQSFESQFASAAVVAAVGASGTDGRAAFDRYADRLEGPVRAKMLQAVEAREKQDRDAELSRNATLFAVNSIDDAPNLSAALEMVRGKAGEDPELAAKAQAETYRLYNQQRIADDRRRSDVFDDARAHIGGGGSAATFAAERPDEWAALSDLQRYQLENPGVKGQETDWTVYTDTLALPKAAMAEVDVTKLPIYGAERKEVARLVAKARGGWGGRRAVPRGESNKPPVWGLEDEEGRTEANRVQVAVEQLMGAPKRDWKPKDQPRVDSLYRILNNVLKRHADEKGGKMPQEAFSKVVADMFQYEGEPSVSVFGMGFGGSQFEIEDIETERLDLLAGAVLAMGKTPDIRTMSSLEEAAGDILDSDHADNLPLITAALAADPEPDFTRAGLLRMNARIPAYTAAMRTAGLDVTPNNAASLHAAGLIVAQRTGARVEDVSPRQLVVGYYDMQKRQIPLDVFNRLGFSEAQQKMLVDADMVDLTPR